MWIHRKKIFCGSTKKNKNIARLLNSFLSKDLRYKKIGSRVSRKFKYPKCKLFFDYFSYVKGLNDEFISTRGKFGEVINMKHKVFKNYNTP